MISNTTYHDKDYCYDFDKIAPLKLSKQLSDLFLLGHINSVQLQTGMIGQDQESNQNLFLNVGSSQFGKINDINYNTFY